MICTVWLTRKVSLLHSDSELSCRLIVTTRVSQAVQSLLPGDPRAGCHPLDNRRPPAGDDCQRLGDNCGQFFCPKILKNSDSETIESSHASAELYTYSKRIRFGLIRHVLMATPNTVTTSENRIFHQQKCVIVKKQK